MSVGMRDLPSGKIRKIHPHAWLWEPLEADPTFLLRPMFGGRAAYLDGKLMLYFTTSTDEDWRGVCVATSHEHHAALMAEFPELAPHPVLPKWLYLRESDNRFESVAERLVSLVRRRDPRIGVVPQKKKRRKIPRPGGRP
ncbi:hypothetical protein OpiT1DRAFT_03186 [Opitutaceae bacterium TAV1]|nr:hypothetical protein OpiT1DRAFT_03186 [Opitutaceae bacterium TAV1]